MIDRAPLEQLTPWTRQMVERLLRYAASQGIDVTGIDSSFRTCGAQDALYAAGTSPQRGCRSWHVWGRAVDLRIPGYPPEPYVILGEKWESWGGVWGASFGTGDLVHFEWHPETDTVSTYCPSADFACPLPPWPDDRPALARPSTWLGLGLAAIGVGAAVRILR